MIPARLTFAGAFLVFLFSIFGFLSMLFNLHFVSKSLALAEMQRPLSFYDYAGPFFLLWFFPIGIWFIQPRINRLYADHTTVLSS